MKILIIGLDGASFDLIDPWAREGKLPHLARLIEDGVRAELRSTVPPVSAPAWISFMTGKGPGKHGVYDFRTFNPRTYSFYDEPLVTSRHYAGGTLFELAGRAGLRVAALSVPMTYPPFPVNGLLLSGFPKPSLRKAYTYPPERAQEFADIEPVSEFERHSMDGRVRLMEHSVRALTDASVRLLRREPYDLFMVVFRNTDIANHHFRKHLHPEFPTYDEAEVSRYGRVLEDQYRLADWAVGRLIEAAGEETLTVVVSDHGSGLHATRYFNTNLWLRQAGLLEPRDPLTIGGTALLRRLITFLRMKTPWARWLVKWYFPSRVKQTISRGMHGVHGIRWAGTKAYRVPMFYFIEGIEVNLVGRQPEGIVPPGEPYEAVRERIARELPKVADPETGRAIVERVLRREECFAGPALERAPDLIVFFDPDYAGGAALRGPLVMPIERMVLREWSGLHRMEGILLMRGGPLRRAARLPRAEIVDLAPTILYLLGVPIPEDMDGTVLEEAIAPEFLSAHPRRRGAREGGPMETMGGLGADEEAEIRETLRGLGYLS